MTRDSEDMTMNRLITGFRRDASGATAIEYGLIAALIAVALIGVLTTMGGSIGDTFTRNGDTISAAGQPAP